MAATGALLTLAIVLGGDPSLGSDLYGPLRGPVSRELAPPGELPPTEEASPIIRPVAGWSVSDAPAAQEPLHPQAVAPLPESTAPPPVFSAPEPPIRTTSAEAALPAPNAAPSGPGETLARNDTKPRSLKLAPPTKSRQRDPAATPGRSATGAVASIVSSLAVVLGLFFAVAWLAKRNGAKGAMLLPAEVVEVLGRTPLTSRHQLQVVRFGNKLLLLSMTPGGAASLAEIEDAAEVERLSAICQELQHGSISEAFRNVFSQFAHEPTREGFAGAE